MSHLPPSDARIIQISNNEGKVDPAWRKNPSQEVQKITQTLDAFNHYVFATLHRKVLIGDLQGMINDPLGANIDYVNE
jgi:hypothetical protein